MTSNQGLEALQSAQAVRLPTHTPSGLAWAGQGFSPDNQNEKMSVPSALRMLVLSEVKSQGLN
jgi:hypothetical protein